jgi:hypothetical protein
MAIDLSRVPQQIQRSMASQLKAALATSPVVVLQGPHASGSLLNEPDAALAALEGSSATADLARTVGGANRHVVDLNRYANRIAAERDPAAVWTGHDRITILEAHRVPALLPALAKAAASSKPGRFLLTSSIHLTGTMFDAEYGRFKQLAKMPMQALTLLPHTQAELYGGANWLDAAFGGKLAQLQANAVATGAELLERVLTGGHLESVARDRPRSRHAWQLKHLEALLDSPPKRRIGAKEEKLLLAFPPSCAPCMPWTSLKKPCPS